MMAYLVMMVIRLQELHRVLKPTGSIYLHCDPTASHYLKLVIDAVFSPKQFRNETIWHYRTFHGQTRRYFPKKHDTIFFYTKSDSWKFNQLFDTNYKETIDFHRWNKYLVNGNKILGANMPMQDSRFVRFYHRWVRQNRREPGLTDIIYELKGQPIDTVWNIKAVDPKDYQRLGYPTQKPEALLERIINASGNEGDIVLDPFCGCGTTVTVAEKLKRKWIGIDITHLAISLMRNRLNDTFGSGIDYKVIGEPVDLKGAEELANQDRYQFQWWALGLVGARPAKSEQKKGPDEGIDGYIYFHDDPKKKEAKEVIIQVKSGHAGSGMIDALKGVVEKKNAQIGVFITLEEPTKPMKTGAVSSGYYRSPLGHNYPKIQILTIKELLEGKKIDYPVRARGTDATFRKAERHEQKGQQKEMEL